MDRIVAATQMRDFVLVFTEQGEVYRVYWDALKEEINWQRQGEIVLSGRQ